MISRMVKGSKIRGAAILLALLVLNLVLVSIKPGISYASGVNCQAVFDNVQESTRLRASVVVGCTENGIQQNMSSIRVTLQFQRYDSGSWRDVGNPTERTDLDVQALPVPASGYVDFQIFQVPDAIRVKASWTACPYSGACHENSAYSQTYNWY